jgi:hypothetical protein
MARKYSERIENMDESAREELDARIREHCKSKGWQATLAKFKPSPIQLRAILAGKDPTKAKAKKKSKAELEAAAKKKAAKAEGKAPKKATKKAPKKKATKKKASKKKAAKKKAAKEAAPKRKPGRPKGSGKKAGKKSARKNGVATKSMDMGDLVIEGRIDATEFMSMILLHSERMLKMAQA